MKSRHCSSVDSEPRIHWPERALRINKTDATISHCVKLKGKYTSTLTCCKSEKSLGSVDSGSIRDQ